MGYFSDEMIESEAAALREMMGLPSDSPLSWRDLESRMERAFPGIRLVVVPNEELRHAAEADTEQNRIRFRQTAYDQLRAGYEWALEVLAHELAHFKLDHKGIRYRSEGLSHGRKRDEPQAHLFARALLAPARAAVKFSSPAALAAEFHLQLSSAEKRLMVVGRMHRVPRALPQNVINFLTEARARGAKVTALDD